MFTATLSLRQTVESPVEGFGLVVNELGYGRVSLEAVESGAARPERATLTQDGRHADPSSWHEGDADPDEWVFYERYEGDARVAHGFVHATTRQLLQAG